MKRMTAIALCVITLVTVCVFTGCGDTEAELVKNTVEVLMVEDGGFVGKHGSDNWYVMYPNASEIFTVGDVVELEYYESWHYAGYPDEPRGGYTWSSILVSVHRSWIQ